MIAPAAVTTHIERCACSTVKTRLPLFLATVTLYRTDDEGYEHEAYAQHFFRECPICTVTFCPCGQQH